ncbi:MAG: 1-deoxy-D-xylulose-5-phosphate reductoisomerase [Nitrosomonadaceae bacterium]|nr:1-deoxy-D-xylulose-5-phosphate reductoisomerase [Nitrosomonadaceae bacterium]|tara:strand:+ start:440 stop:1627 length:1188 start_codon:yes stop_codon:yes gene_type:complete
MAARNITILGSTGSVGISTLDVVSRHPNKYQIVALTANKSSDKMLDQCRIFHPQYAVMLDPISADNLKTEITKEGIDTEVLCGVESLEKVASLPEVDIVMAAIVGAAGIRPTFAAASKGKYVLLANKETLVMAGRIFMDIVKKNHATLLPIDSEHNAIFQSLPKGFTGNHKQSGVRRILLTASGGPFRKTSLSDIKNVTPEQACNHPNWDMGRKISVDSATMMNKGLEIIEAHWLFDAKPENIQVVIHPQSIIHSMVEYIDGSVLAQLGNPDMRTPIAHALAYPERIECGVTPLDIFKVASLNFEQPDFSRFPCLNLAYKALSTGGSSPAVLNAANEVAVEAFLKSRIPFTAIPSIIQQVMESIESTDIFTLEDILAIDNLARNATYKLIDSEEN